jgi:hypothetical protein
MIFYWTYVYKVDFFSTSIANFINRLLYGGIEKVSRVTSIETINELYLFLEKISYIILITIAILGSLYIIQQKQLEKKDFDKKLLLIFLSFVFLIIIYLPSLIGVDVFIPTRWFIFLYSFVVILAGFGLHVIYQNIIKKGNNKIGKFIIISILIFFVFFSMINPKYNPNSVILENESPRTKTFSSSEISASYFIKNIWDKDYTIFRSEDYGKVLRGYTSGGYKNNMDIDLNPNLTLAKKEINKTNGSLLAIRYIDIKMGFTIPIEGSFFSYNMIPTQGYLKNFNNTYDKIYHSNNVYIFKY